MGSAVVAPPVALEMGLSAEEKRRRRALAAGPYPRPRGRAPRHADGVVKTWDKEHGGWKVDASPAWTWSSTLDFGAGDTIDTAPVTAPATVTTPTAACVWDPPVVWRHGSDSSSATSERLHECVLLTPRGSRTHSFEHTSPGGTTRVEEYKSPPGGATREERCGRRSRIARERMEARGIVVFEPYCTGLSLIHI